MARLTTGVVLGAGAARGAYEVGVLAWLREELGPELGASPNLDILTGTSVGAIHACYLAGTLEAPATQVSGLMAAWESMRIGEILRFSHGDVWRLLRDAVSRRADRPGRIPRDGGLVDPSAMRALVGQRVPWARIGRNLRQGLFQALAVSATHVDSGRTRVFVQRREGGLPPWTTNPQLEGIATRIGPCHALASAAIPILFPAVRVRGVPHVDGALRMSVPLSPALRLGAQRVILISPSPHAMLRGSAEGPEATQRHRGSMPSLAGMALDALLADRADEDLARLEQINNLINAGVAAHGEAFLDTLVRARHGSQVPPLGFVRALLVRPSENLGAIAADFVRTREFRSGGEGLAHRAILRLIDSGNPGEADLASHLLFERGYAARLIELGRRDARALRDDWIRFFSDAPQCPAEAALAERSGRASPGTPS